MSKLLRQLLAIAALVLVFVAGQENLTLAGTTGTINGKVTDEAGHPIAGVSVGVVAPSFALKTATGPNGFYALTGLPPDTYTVTFQREGYSTRTVQGVTLSQDQTYVQNVTLPHEVGTLGRISVRGTTSLVQPTETVNRYQVTSQSVTAITGTPQDISETAVLNSLPGVTTDSVGYPIIRGGAENDEGFELEGIDATEPITGQFINSLSLNGVGRLQLSTGGYDVSEGNTNSGVVNVVSKRGTYPGEGEATARMSWPAFDHRLALSTVTRALTTASATTIPSTEYATTLLTAMARRGTQHLTTLLIIHPATTTWSTFSTTGAPSVKMRFSTTLISEPIFLT